MFIWTISDIAAVIILLFFVIAGIVTAVSAHFNAKQYECKKEPEPEHKEPKKEAPFWMCAITLVIVLAAIYAYCAWRGWLH